MKIKKIVSFIMMLALCAGFLRNIGYGGKEVMAAETDSNITIYIAGDSTVCDWDAIKTVGYYAPQAGWGQVFDMFFDESVTVVDGAISGYSSKTFYDGCVAKSDYVRHLDVLLANAKEGDYLFVQFGHNDSAAPTTEQLTTRPDIAERYVTTEEYKTYLSYYIADAREKGVIPVLVTPCCRNSRNAETGKYSSSFAAYAEAMRELAEEEECLLIDLFAASEEYYEYVYNTLGEDGVKQIFLNVVEGAYTSYYSGKTSDSTHYQYFGAVQNARLVAQGIKELAITDLCNRLEDNVDMPQAVPKTPTNLKKVSDDGSTYKFKWDAVDGADTYAVYEVTNDDSGNEVLSYIKQVETNEVNIYNLTENTDYTFCVVAKNMAGDSASSEYISRLADINEDKDFIIYTIGDSLVQSYSDDYLPQTGWGQVISEYFTDNVGFVNKAIGGRSTGNFLRQGRLDEVLEMLNEGDYVFIEFGHNDATVNNEDRYVSVEDYKINLAEYYIAPIREKGAIPVLVTICNRNDYDASGNFNVSFSEYVTAMREVAEETDCALIDLNALTVSYFTELSKSEYVGVTDDIIFNHAIAGAYTGQYAEGVSDNTHLGTYGAKVVAGMVAKAASELGYENLASNYVAPNVTTAPEAVTNITSKTYTDDNCRIGFDAAEGADYYIVEVANAENGEATSDYELAGYTVATLFSYSDAVSGNDYVFRVTAVNAAGKSEAVTYYRSATSAKRSTMSHDDYVNSWYVEEETNSWTIKDTLLKIVLPVGTGVLALGGAALGIFLKKKKKKN